MSRREVALRIAELVGPEGLTIDDPADGWPAQGAVLGVDHQIPVALFVAPIGLSHRHRDEVERRFQNPGRDRPIESIAGRQLMFIGIWEDDPLAPDGPAVLVTADPNRRIGRTTRFSVFPRLESLLIARATGIHVGHTTTGEEITAFSPALLPAQVHAQVSGVELDETRYRHEFMAAASEPADARQRRISSTLVRANGFARAVQDAYERACAMCEVGLHLVESAHILPVAAPGSVDQVRNGLALCANHHRAFDQHQIWVDPDTGAIVIHPEMVSSTRSRADQFFVTSTRSTILIPSNATERADPAMFRARYRYFEDDYAWAR